MRKNKWRMNKGGELIYGYKCYNQLNNGSKQLRVDANLSTEGYCDLKEICDWKLEMMSKKIFQGLWGDYQKVIEEACRIYNQVYCEDRQLDASEKNVFNERLIKLKKRLENLTEMRMDGEISKEEFQELKFKLTNEISSLEVKILDCENASIEPEMKKLSEEELRAILSRKLDFSQLKMDRDVIESFIARIVPMSHTEFRWDMNFLPRKEGAWEEYQNVWTFQIGFDEAKEYKKLNKGMLRQSQWQDLTVHVYM